MDAAKIFLVDDKQSGLIPMSETAYVTEDVLQDLLARYPDLLPGDQIDPENPPRWLLVSREMGVPGDEDESDRWSLDHLFLDQDGVPTFVECKRATDTRSRREVVAQMLDYAANGVEYWGIDRVRQAAAETAQGRGKTLDDVIARLLGDDGANVEAYWKAVETNLHGRRARLLFVMDDIPRELRRLVEFLNEEMTNVEVLAVEIKQFQREDSRGQKALVPRVVGFTETARSVKEGTGQRGRLTRTAFANACTPEAGVFFQRVLDIAENRGLVVEWGKDMFSLRSSFADGEMVTLAYGEPPDEFRPYINKGWLRLSAKEFSTLRKELLAFGVFRESGQWTLVATVTQENQKRMDEVYDFFLERMDKIIKAH